jgi:uncharacterized protein (DUF58 family)
MSRTILSRYLDPDVLNRIARQRVDPRGLVLGNLAGAHKSPLSGFAVEFAGHREYGPGDDPKHIDWRVYFNRGKYFIKQYEMETNLVCHLLLDVSASMRYGSGHEQKLQCGARLATVLAHTVVRQSDKVSLTTFDDQIRGSVPPGNTLAQVIRMVDHVAHVEPRHETRLAACLEQVAGRIGRRQIVMILSDFFTPLDTLEKALQRLKFDHHEVVLFHVLHRDEIEFRLDGNIRFAGLETADRVACRPSDIRPAYLAAVRRFREGLSATCVRNRCELVPVTTDRDLGDLLVDYLNERTLAPAY